MIAELVGGKLDGTTWKITEFTPELYYAEEDDDYENFKGKILTYVAFKRVSDDKVLYKLEGL